MKFAAAAAVAAVCAQLSRIFRAEKVLGKQTFSGLLCIY